MQLHPGCVSLSSANLSAVLLCDKMETIEKGWSMDIVVLFRKSVPVLCWEVVMGFWEKVKCLHERNLQDERIRIDPHSRTFSSFFLQRELPHPWNVIILSLPPLRSHIWPCTLTANCHQLVPESGCCWRIWCALYFLKKLRKGKGSLNYWVGRISIS